MTGTRKITILHSNDMHGDFLAEQDPYTGRKTGGLALISGYLNKVRHEEENVLFLIAGDIVQGNLIDSEYKGISTMDMVNYLIPDAIALGNHEFDYGLSHLLFLEKVANFPIVNANLYLKPFNKRLMKPFCILKKAGLDILVTGIITEKVMDTIKGDNVLRSFVDLEEASQEVGKITNAYKGDDIDLTIILTHIGIESDIELARLLKPEWGVDIIVGGHSHTILDKPIMENGVIIVTAGEGTNQIGRLDVVIDDETNRIIDYQWQLVHIDESLVEPDRDLEKFIHTYEERVEDKYSAMISKLKFKHTHPMREVETSLGNLFADALAEMTESDIMFLASGSIRSKEIGPMVALRDMATGFPYDEPLTRYTVTGTQLRRMFGHIMRKVNRNGEGECFQVNGNVKAIYDEGAGILRSLSVKGNEVLDNDTFRICIQPYHAKNSKAFLDISSDELNSIKPKVVTTSAREVLEEWLRNNQNCGREIEGRLIYY